MCDETRELMTKIVLGEIAGKNNAIHAYDKQIWTVRTGCLTLMFAGWGFLLSSLAKDIGAKSEIRILLFAMLVVSISIALGG